MILPDTINLVGIQIGGRFDIETVHNRDRFGPIFKGTDTADGGSVLVRTLPLNDEATTDRRERFRYTAEQAGRVAGEGLAEVLEHGEGEAGESRDPYLYRVDERASGTSLYRLYTRSERFAVDRLVRIAREVAGILEHAHRADLYHLRLGLSDILVRSETDREVFVQVQNFAGGNWGAPPYNEATAAPELFTGGEIGSWTDVYILGQVMWQILEGMPHNFPHAKQAHLNDDPWPSPDHPDLPAAVDAIVRRAIRKDPSERYETVSALREDLEAFLSGASSNAATEGTAEGRGAETPLVALQERTQMPLPGERVGGRYRVEELLGSGGYARVFRAVDEEDGRQVGLKILSTDEAWDEKGRAEDARKRFRRESRVLSQLTSPHTVALLDYGVTDEERFVQVLEYVDGRDLAERIGEGMPMKPARVAAVMRRVLDSLGEAHRQGIVHRDVKPANIILTTSREGSPELRVVDFGIAKIIAPRLDWTQTDLTSTGVVPGTPRYMAPEQIQGESLGPATDLYSLGLVAVELLVGTPAVEGETFYQVMTAHITGGPRQKIEETGLDAPFGRVLERLLDPDPEARYGRAEEVVSDLPG